MRNVCEDCKYAKPKGGGTTYCVKYGIIRYEPRVYCVAWDRTEKTDGEREHEQILCEKDRG